MTSPSAMSPPARATKKWLGTLWRSGGGAASTSVVLPVFSGGLLLVQAGLLAHVLHAAIVGGAPLANLFLPISLTAAVLVFRIGLGLAGEMLASVSSELIKQRLRQALVSAILAKPPIWTAARSGGGLSTLVVEQVEAMDGYLTRYVPAMAQAAILPLAFAAAVFPIDWMAGLLFIVTAPLIPIFMALAGWGAEAASRRQADALARLTGHFADRLRGLTTLKLFGREVAEAEGVARASEQLRVRTMRVMRIAFLSSAILEFFAALGVAGVALYVGLTFLHLIDLRGAPLTLEAGLFCLLMAPEVYQPLRLLATHYHDQAAAKAAAAEIMAQLHELPSLTERPVVRLSAARIACGPASLELRNVAVSTPTGRTVIVHASVSVAPGEHIAILGESGSGKSSLLEAIAGLRPISGSIRLDGVDVATVDPSVLRARQAVLGQRPTIFAGSVAENIRLGRVDACDTALRLAASRAGVLEVADDLPGGLGCLLGEDGVGLSGGEIHRVALARIYLRDPGLLLLDEPTAHLDATTEQRVLDGLLEFARGRSMFVVTHSAAVAARMDRCFRIIDGRLVPASAAMPLRGAA